MSSTKISKVHALEILDSRGNPTIEAEVTLTDGTCARGAVPSGASTGIREAVELRDGDSKRYLGKGVQKAVANVNKTIAPVLLNMDPCDQISVDNAMLSMDGTENKSKLGANAMLAVSVAVARAAAQSMGSHLYDYLAIATDKTLPIPFFNILNGGAHANNNIDIQEFMVVPLNMPDFKEALRCGVEIYHSLKRTLDSSGLSTAVGDEGGFAPNLGSNKEALDLICNSIRQAGYEPGEQVGIALDVASSELFNDNAYILESENLTLTSAELIGYLENLVAQYPIISLEDAIAENDWQGWIALTERMGKKVQLVGDDVFVTNPAILKSGINQAVGNAILIKLNQIGTITETIEAVRIAKEANYGVMISHRSGETEDDVIADFAVATAAGQIKSGAPCRSDRTAKYNRLLRIESMPDNDVIYTKSLHFGD